MRNRVVVDNFLVKGSYRYIFDKSKKYGLYEKCFSTFVESLTLYDKIYLDLPANAGSVESQINLKHHYEILDFFKGNAFEIPWGVDKEIFNEVFTKNAAYPLQKLSVLTGGNKKKLEEYLQGKFNKTKTGIPLLDEADAIPYAKSQLQFDKTYPSWENEILDMHNAELNLDNIDFFAGKPELRRNHAKFMSSSFHIYNMFRLWVICNANKANYIPDPLSKIFIKNSTFYTNEVFSPLRQVIIEEFRRFFKNKIRSPEIQDELSRVLRTERLQTSSPNLFKFVISDGKDPDALKNKILELRNSKEAKSYRKWCSKLEKPEIGKGDLDILKEIKYTATDLQDRFEIKESPHTITWLISARIDPNSPLGFALKGSLKGDVKIPSFRKVLRKFKQTVTRDKHIDFLNMTI